MFGWRRKPEGFDWQKYVKTTILVRRKARRDKLGQARDAAADQVQAAGIAALRGAKAAGAAARDGAVKGGGRALKGGVAGLRVALDAGARGLDPAGQALAKGVRPLLLTLQRAAVAGPLALCGLIALSAALYRWRHFGLDVEAAAPLSIGVLLLAAAVPSLLARFGLAIPPTFRPLQPKRGRVVALSALGVCIAAAGTVVALRGMPAWTALPVLGSTLGTLGALKLPGFAAKPIEGRATAVAGDVLRIDSKLIRLAGIEAPDRQQTCNRQPGNKKWRCGEQAQAALEKLVRGKAVRCDPAGVDDADRTTATCSVDGRDLAADLVAEGLAFASSSLFGGYALAEAAARQKKAGIWSGEADRPEAYREKLWETAKKSAPDGCPIKGRVTASGKLYMLPWSPDYSGTSVRAARGERWFCSEREADAAGWRAG